jgi:ParB-like chromosome segregation protein Spo0J
VTAAVKTAAVKTAFEKETVRVPLAKILPTRALPAGAKAGSKYKAIEASFAVVGIIEPLVVCRQPDGHYLLLDGHSRLTLLKEAGANDVECIVSTDDEGYTYNRCVSHLAPIQANRMILKALDAGVPDERLAKALDRSVTTIRMSRTMLKDICAEALELLKDKPVATAALRLFKHVKPLRQIEMAELMTKMANYTRPYASGLVSRTPPEYLVEQTKVKRPVRPKPEDLARMEVEMQALEKDILLIDESYGRNVVNLTLARGYVKKLLENAKVVKYLASKHADVLTEFQRIQEAASLEN